MGHRTSFRAAPPPDLAVQGCIFVFELSAPVAEVLQRQPMNLAILTLIQIAALPTLHVRAPKRAHHLSVSCSEPAHPRLLDRRNRGRGMSAAASARTIVQQMDGYDLAIPIPC